VDEQRRTRTERLTRAAVAVALGVVLVLFVYSLADAWFF
jgi:hypothetical protein